MSADRSWRTSPPVACDRSFRPTEEALNIISCPSCSRVENEAFVDLAQRVKEMTRYAQQHALTIAVMGCRVNGPGETDDADLGLWCGPHHVNLKRSGQTGRGVQLRRDSGPAAGGTRRLDCFASRRINCSRTNRARSGEECEPLSARSASSNQRYSWPARSRPI